MKSRLELVLGIDNRIPAPPHAKRIVVSEDPPASGAAGHAPGCLWIDAASGSLHVNTGTADQADWTQVGSSD